MGLCGNFAVPTESSASHNGETFARETEAIICDHRGSLEFSSTIVMQVGSVPELGKGWRVRRYKVVILY